MAVMLAGVLMLPSISGWSDLFEFASSSRSHTFTISPLLALLAAILDLSVTTTPMRPYAPLGATRTE